MNKELSILQGYYKAMSSQNLNKTISYLDKDVYVCFPEEDRNWCGSMTALNKFEDMFKKWPSFQGRYSIISKHSANSYVEVKLACKFSCELTSMVSKRDMIYRITKNTIIYIAHL